MAILCLPLSVSACSKARCHAPCHSGTQISRTEAQSFHFHCRHVTVQNLLCLARIIGLYVEGIPDVDSDVDA